MDTTDAPTRRNAASLIDPTGIVLGIALGAFALVRPLFRIGAEQLGSSVPGFVPLLLTLGITIVWVLVVGLGRNRAPIPTLVVAGVSYAVIAMALSGVLSPILDGQFSGPLANPIAIVPMLLINGLWGAASGALAMLVQRMTGLRAG